MTAPRRRWAEITLRAPRLWSEAVASTLEGCGCPGVAYEDPKARSADAWATADDGPAPSAGDWLEIVGHMPVDDRLTAALTRLRESLARLTEAGLPETAVRLTWREEDDWAEAWKAHFHPQRVGRRLVVQPSWEPADLRPGEVAVTLDPGMAFGTGLHPTTRMCLEALEDLITPGMELLDWGTGSGILSLVAARLGATLVLALDADPVAVRVARENVVSNDLQSSITVREGSLDCLPTGRRFAGILANILAEPIIAGAPALARHVQPGGWLVLSGITEAGEADVRAALSQAGLRHVDRRCAGEWRALVVRPV